MVGAILAALTSLALLVAVFVPLERAFPARKGQRVLRRELALDATFFFGQYLVWNAVAFSLLANTQTFLAAYQPAALQARVASLPVGVQIALAVVLGDFLVYWFHRACHAWEPLWHFHAVHHSSEQLDFLAAHREHPLDGIGTQLAANLPAFALGLDVRPLAAIVALRGMWAIFVHSNVRLPLGPLRWILGAPELHHWHHARVERTQHNFANLAPWLDVIFGTHHLPEGEETYALGIDPGPASSHRRRGDGTLAALGLAVDGPWPRGYVAQLVHPFALLAKSASRHASRVVHVVSGGRFQILFDARRASRGR